MKNLFFLILLTFVITTNTYSQSATEICSKGKIQRLEKLLKASEINYPGDENVDMTYYKLNLNITFSPSYIDGIITVRGKSMVNDLSELYLDLTGSFTVDSVIAGAESLSFNHVDTRVYITLDSLLSQNDEFEFDIYYQGSPGNSGFGSYEATYHDGSPVIWTLSEPYGAKDWWPCKDTPADKVDSSDVWITANDIFVTVSNGNLEDVIDNGDGTKTYKWDNDQRIAQYLISIAMTNYEKIERSFTWEDVTMPVDHYIYPENNIQSRIKDLNRTTNMLEIFSNLFGPYPFLDQKYAHAEFGWGGAMEHQTASTMGAFFSSIVAHELAHQWFGDMITCKDWHHIWLNEGFATYSESLYLEHSAGWQYYMADVQGNMSSAKGAVGSIWVENINSVSQIFSGARSYAKGSVVLHMLRGVLGDSLFFESLRTYADDPELKYDVATTEDFQSVVEEVTGEDLDYFFSEWIYGENYPRYSYEWGSTNQTDGTYEVYLKINQQRNSNPAYFTMPVQIGVNTTQGDTIVTVFNNTGLQEYYFTVSGRPTSLTFDPDNWILKDIVGITEVAYDDKGIISDYKLNQNYPNPFNPTTTISYEIPSASDVTLKVFDVLGNEVATLVNEHKQSGRYQVEFDGSKLTSGVYFYQITAGEFSATMKFSLIK
ncbi:MAG: T9SS type A sorting domain-containing protein [Melioribacteraceae bacterium]|nr:T9SS type A sorting domain-containing protein [Melioribacteraceae bacterium]MCF8356206.1 T9SS type A sorting domain-containing protein [Melioribacteraceae bacterium]MCF8395859.1 T9SS type A sorting domain-containing protein [Melioribacteraceae bacterium]MCF8420047.1 T9SS type A sorting domain-containing protein [Melioribacteraceae bacterium]